MAAFLNAPVIFVLKCSLLTLLVVGGASNSGLNGCPFDYFYDRTEDGCTKCSSCPDKHITIRPCSKSADVECRPYTLKNVHDVGSETSNFKFNSDLKSSSNSNTAIDKDRSLGTLNRGSSNDGDNTSGENSSNHVNSELNSGEDNYWKTLAFALIGLLSVLIITTFIILIFVYKKLQKSIVITQTEDADLMDDADSGYVVIRAIDHMAAPRSDSNHPFLSLFPQDQTMDNNHYHTHPSPAPNFTMSAPGSIDSGRPADSLSMSTPVSANDNDDSKSCFLPQTYQPQRRLLNYDADDVFESDDNTSVSHNHIHNHHRHADPKRRLQALLDENPDS